MNISTDQNRQLQKVYRDLEAVLREQRLLVQGSVNAIPALSPTGNEHYTWTRKVRAKTITVALSAQQAVAFRKAVAANRTVEEILHHLREMSQEAMLSNLAGVSKRRKPDVSGEKQNMS